MFLAGVADQGLPVQRRWRYLTIGSLTESTANDLGGRLRDELPDSAEIWIEVYDGERVVESAEINVQFLPLQGKQDGVFVTTQDPASHFLRGRIESLQFP